MNKALILVVEDDRPIRNLIVTTLKTHDYKYITAENGSSAILEASSHKPEIILLDLGLPDMEGVDVIKKVRTWSNVPIIVISARSEDVDPFICDSYIRVRWKTAMEGTCKRYRTCFIPDEARLYRIAYINDRRRSSVSR